MNQRVGTCSLCGGDVIGFRGAWWSTVPPGPDKCSRCGAVRAEDVIEMRHPGGFNPNAPWPWPHTGNVQPCVQCGHALGHSGLPCPNGRVTCATGVGGING